VGWCDLEWGPHSICDNWNVFPFCVVKTVVHLTLKNPQTKPIDLGCESAENWQLPSTSTIAIVIITQSVGWYSFYRPIEGERLSRPTHCSKGAQPVPKAVHIAAVVYALATNPLLVFGDKLDEKAQRRRMIYYFASAAVAVDSSDMTASSSASWSRFSPPSNFANGHVSTMWFMICCVAGHSHKKVIGRDPICSS